MFWRKAEQGRRIRMRGMRWGQPRIRQSLAEGRAVLRPKPRVATAGRAGREGGGRLGTRSRAGVKGRLRSVRWVWGG